jgi:hypothetical protein
MRDRYTELFITDEVLARHELDMLAEEYSETGMYACAGGFVVWADLSSDREIAWREEA